MKLLDTLIRFIFITGVVTLLTTLPVVVLFLLRTLNKQLEERFGANAWGSCIRFFLLALMLVIIVAISLPILRSALNSLFMQPYSRTM
jgi:hypothetical protein